MSGIVILGRRFGRRTGYTPENPEKVGRFKERRAKIDASFITGNPTEVNAALELINKLVTVKIPVEIKVIREKFGKEGPDESPLDIRDLCVELRKSNDALWRSAPFYYAKLAVEIECRIERAQRFEVEGGT